MIVDIWKALERSTEGLNPNRKMAVQQFRRYRNALVKQSQNLPVHDSLGLLGPPPIAHAFERKRKGFPLPRQSMVNSPVQLRRPYQPNATPNTGQRKDSDFHQGRQNDTRLATPVQYSRHDIQVSTEKTSARLLNVFRNRQPNRLSHATSRSSHIDTVLAHQTAVPTKDFPPTRYHGAPSFEFNSQFKREAEHAPLETERTQSLSRLHQIERKSLAKLRADWDEIEKIVPTRRASPFTKHSFNVSTTAKAFGTVPRPKGSLIRRKPTGGFKSVATMKPPPAIVRSQLESSSSSQSWPSGISSTRKSEAPPGAVLPIDGTVEAVEAKGSAKPLRPDLVASDVRLPDGKGATDLSTDDGDKDSSDEGGVVI